jgi:uncharacterized paraquat-inducible protein A
MKNVIKKYIIGNKKRCCPKCGATYKLTWLFIRLDDIGTRCKHCNAKLSLRGINAIYAPIALISAFVVFPIFLSVTMTPVLSHLLSGLNMVIKNNENFYSNVNNILFVTIFSIASFSMFMFFSLIIPKYFKNIGYISMTQDDLSDRKNK